MTRPTEADIWRIAITPDPDLEFERVLAMSDEEVRASLVSHGYDLRVLEAEAAMLWSQHRTRKLHGGYLIGGGVGVLGSIGVLVGSLLGPAAVETAPILMATAASPPPVVVQQEEVPAVTATAAAPDPKRVPDGGKP